MEFFLICDIIHDIHSIRGKEDSNGYNDYNGIELLDINLENINLNKDIKNFFNDKYKLNDSIDEQKKEIINKIKKTPENICFEILQQLYERDEYYKFYYNYNFNDEDKEEFDELQYNFTYVDIIGQFKKFVKNEEVHTNYEIKLKPSIGTIIDSACYYNIKKLNEKELIYPDEKRLKLEFKLFNDKVIPDVKKIYNELDNYEITLKETIKYNKNGENEFEEYNILNMNNFKSLLKNLGNNKKKTTQNEDDDENDQDDGIIFTFNIKNRITKIEKNIEIPKLGIKKLKQYIYDNNYNGDKKIYTIIKEAFGNEIKICNSILLMFKTLGDYSQSYLSCQPASFIEDDIIQDGGNLLVRRYRKYNNKKLKKKIIGGVNNSTASLLSYNDSSTSALNKIQEKKKGNLFITGDKICGVIATYNSYNNIKKNNMIYYSSPSYRIVFDNNINYFNDKTILEIIEEDFKTKYSNYLTDISYDNNSRLFKLYFKLDTENLIYEYNGKQLYTINYKYGNSSDESQEQKENLDTEKFIISEEKIYDTLVIELDENNNIDVDINIKINDDNKNNFIKILNKINIDINYVINRYINITKYNLYINNRGYREEINNNISKIIKYKREYTNKINKNFNKIYNNIFETGNMIYNIINTIYKDVKILELSDKEKKQITQFINNYNTNINNYTHFTNSTFNIDSFNKLIDKLNIELKKTIINKNDQELKDKNVVDIYLIRNKIQVEYVKLENINIKTNCNEENIKDYRKQIENFFTDIKSTKENIYNKTAELSEIINKNNEQFKIDGEDFYKTITDAIRKGREGSSRHSAKDDFIKKFQRTKVNYENIKQDINNFLDKLKTFTGGKKIYKKKLKQNKDKLKQNKDKLKKEKEKDKLKLKKEKEKLKLKKEKEKLKLKKEKEKLKLKKEKEREKEKLKLKKEKGKGKLKKK